MYQIRMTLRPDGYSRLDLDTDRSEFQEADKFFEHVRKFIFALEGAARSWTPSSKEGRHDD